MTPTEESVDGLFWGLVVFSASLHLVLFIFFAQWGLTSPGEQEQPVPVSVMVQAELVDDSPAAEATRFQLDELSQLEMDAGGFTVEMPGVTISRVDRPASPATGPLSLLDRADVPDELDFQFSAGITGTSVSPSPPPSTQLPLRSTGQRDMADLEEPEVGFFPVQGENLGFRSEDLTLLDRPPTPSEIVLRDDSDVEGSFRLRVAASGEVESVEVVDSTGSSSLDELLMSWIEEWVYEPRSEPAHTIVQVASPGEERDA